MAPPGLRLQYIHQAGPASLVYHLSTCAAAQDVTHHARRLGIGAACGEAVRDWSLPLRGATRLVASEEKNFVIGQLIIMIGRWRTKDEAASN